MNKKYFRTLYLAIFCFVTIVMVAVYFTYAIRIDVFKSDTLADHILLMAVIYIALAIPLLMIFPYFILKRVKKNFDGKTFGLFEDFLFLVTSYIIGMAGLALSVSAIIFIIFILEKS